MIYPDHTPRMRSPIEHEPATALRSALHSSSATLGSDSPRTGSANRIKAGRSRSRASSSTSTKPPQLDSYAQLKKKLAALSKIDAISPWSRSE
jgi:hypothetical protein